MLKTFEQKCVFARWFGWTTIIAFTLVMLPILPVMAQSIDAVPPTGGVDFTPLAEQVISVAVIVLTTLAGLVSKFAISWISSKTRMQDSQFEALLAERVSDILQRSIDYAEMWAKAEVADPNSQIKHVRIDNFFVKTAADYAMRSMPDMLAFFNISEERLKDMIRSRLNGVVVTPEADSAKVETITGMSDNPGTIMSPASARKP